jgi:hypothetical protein
MMFTQQAALEMMLTAFDTPFESQFFGLTNTGTS